MERELASMWELSFVVPPDHGITLQTCSLVSHHLTFFCYFFLFNL